MQKLMRFKITKKNEEKTDRDAKAIWFEINKKRIWRINKRHLQ